MSYPPSGLPAADMRLGIGFDGASGDHPGMPVIRITNSLLPSSLSPPNKVKHDRMVARAKICDAVVAFLLVAMVVSIAVVLTSKLPNRTHIAASISMVTPLALAILKLRFYFKGQAQKALEIVTTTPAPREHRV